MPKKKILLIEDDLTMSRLLGTLLTIEGYDVVTYQKYRDQSILNLLQNELPDAILMDVHLNFANGFDILQTIREIKSFDNIKIIMSSGIDYSMRCREMNVNGFLQKPYMPDELLSWLKRELV